MMEARGIDTGPVGSIREQAMAYAFAEEKRYDLKVLDVIEAIMLHPYLVNGANLQNAWGMLFNYLDKKNTVVTKKEAKENLKEAETRINTLLAKRRAEWQAKKNSTGD